MFEYQIKTFMAQLPEFQARPFEYRMSKAGDCERMMDYAVQRGEGAPDPSQALRMYFGTKIHDMWRELLEKIMPGDFHGAEVEAKYHDTVDGEEFVIVGHPDGQIKSLNAVYELKSVSENTFNLINQQGHALPMHYEQANLYAHVLGMTQVVFHYFNKNNSESLFLVAPASASVAKQTIEKFRRRKVNARDNVIAPRPYTDPTSSPCWFCKFKTECYEGYAQQVSSMSAQVLPIESPVYDDVEMAWNMRAIRLEHEKKEEVAKAALADKLIKLGINRARIGRFAIDLKLGGKQNPLTTIKEIK